MPGQYPYTLLNEYPHLRLSDVAIWQRFIIRYPNFFESVDYDVKVGELPEELKTLPPNYLKDAEQLYLDKIDVVGYRDNEHWIIEIRPHAGKKALGYILGYEELYKRKIKDDKIKIVKAVITDLEIPQIRELYEKYDIKYYVV